MIKAFSSLDLLVSSILITSLFWLWINWLKGSVKIKLKSFMFLWYNILVPFPFVFLFWFSFPLFSLFVCVITCLFSLVLHSFSIFKHAKLLDLKFFVLLCSCVFELGFRAYIHMHAFYMHTHTQSMCTHRTRLRTQANVCAHILIPRNPNPNLFASVSFFYLYNMPLPCLVLCLWVYDSMFVCCLSFTC